MAKIVPTAAPGVPGTAEPGSAPPTSCSCCATRAKRSSWCPPDVGYPDGMETLILILVVLAIAWLILSIVRSL